MTSSYQTSDTDNFTKAKHFRGDSSKTLLTKLSALSEGPFTKDTVSPGVPTYFSYNTITTDNTKPDLGGTFIYKIESQSQHMLTGLTWKVTVDALTAGAGGASPCYCKWFPLMCIEYVKVKFDNREVQRFTGVEMLILMFLHQDPVKKLPFDRENLGGGTITDRQSAATAAQTFYADLRMLFFSTYYDQMVSEGHENAFPKMCINPRGAIEIHIKTYSETRLLQQTTANTKPTATAAGDYITDAVIEEEYFVITEEDAKHIESQIKAGQMYVWKFYDVKDDLEVTVASAATSKTQNLIGFDHVTAEMVFHLVGATKYASNYQTGNRWDEWTDTTYHQLKGDGKDFMPKISDHDYKYRFFPKFYEGDETIPHKAWPMNQNPKNFRDIVGGQNIDNWGDPELYLECSALSEAHYLNIYSFGIRIMQLSWDPQYQKYNLIDTDTL